MNLTYVKHEKIPLKSHPLFNEAWLRDRIAEDSSILGLGDLDVRAVERPQPGAGRLDLLLVDPEAGKRYEVELMLGAVDESHIIRTIEYWDIERKRYPNYEHTAVLVAEIITARFLNVISLFNSAIPLIAIQLNALRVGDNIVLNFVKVLDEVIPGEDDEAGGETVDRADWETKGSKESVAVADACLAIIRDIDGRLNLKFNKHYIGLADQYRPNDSVTFVAKRQFLRVQARLDDQETWKDRLGEAGLIVLPGVSQRERLYFRLNNREAEQHRGLLKELFEACYREQGE
jgi:hypothetical protein